jgi:hypothetical protein
MHGRQRTRNVPHVVLASSLVEKALLIALSVMLAKAPSLKQVHALIVCQANTQQREESVKSARGIHTQMVVMQNARNVRWANTLIHPMHARPVSKGST